MIEIFPHHLSATDAEKLRERLQKLSPEYWVDRSQHHINRTLSGQNGYYFSAGERALPVDLVEDLRAITPQIDPFDCDEIVVNRYPRGGFLPQHRDVAGHLAFALLTLSVNSGAFVAYKNEQSQTIPDQSGQLLIVRNMMLVHEVPPVPCLRHTVIFLYR